MNLPDISFGTTRKRKTIDDFFRAVEKEGATKAHRTGKEQDPSSPSSVPGLKIINDFVTSKEEVELLAYLDAQQWRTDLARRVIHYGGTYCLMPPRSATMEERKAVESTILTADRIPTAIEFVLQRMVQQGIYTPTNKPAYCIVNEYRDNQGISAHVENLKFISPVCGLTLGNGDWIRFHELFSPDDGSVRSGKAATAKRTGKKTDVWMPPRSLLVMSGAAREKWQHEIVRSRRGRVGADWKRVSLTFRAEKRT